MSDISEISTFFQYFFKELNKQKVTYCVLRNYEDLPYSSGRDVDMWIKKEDQEKIQRVIFDTTQRLSWEIIRDTASDKAEGKNALIIFKENNNSIAVIRLEYFLNITRNGVNYINERFIPNFSLFHKDCFYIPSPGLEAAITLFKELIPAKRVGEKYKERTIRFLEQESNIFLKVITESFGKKVAQEAIDILTREKNWEELEKKSNIFRINLITRSLIKRPFSQIKQWLFIFYNRFISLLSFKKSRGFGFFIVLIGPDGCGKTTTAKKLIESTSSKRIFLNRLYYYRNFGILPQLKKISKTMIGYTPKEINYTKDSDFQFSFFRSIAYIFYYGLEYFLARTLVRREKRRGSLIVFDRYFYEYFLQRAYNKCPRWLLSFFGKIIVQPDLIVFLKNNPETIYSRKQDITVKEIENQNNLCQKIIDRNPKKGLVVETNIDTESVTREIQREILYRLKKRCGPKKNSF